MKKKKNSRSRNSKNRLKRLRAMYDDICQNCGITVNDNDYYIIDGNMDHRVIGITYPTLQHIVPISLRGKNSLDNLTLWCYYCNLQDSKRLSNLSNDILRQFPNLVSRSEFEMRLAQAYLSPCKSQIQNSPAQQPPNF